MYVKNYLTNKVLKEEMFTAGAIAGGITIGMILTAINSFLNSKKISCDKIEDPYLKDECMLKVIDSAISQLNISKSSCEKTPDPAECKLALVKKTDKLLKKKQRIQAHMTRIERLKNSEDI